MEEEPNRLERIEFVSGRVYTLAAPRRGREWYRRGGPLATGGLRGSTGCRHRFLLTVSRVPPILTGQSCISVVVRSVRVRLSLSLSFFSLSLSLSLSLSPIFFLFTIIIIIIYFFFKLLISLSVFFFSPPVSFKGKRKRKQNREAQKQIFSNQFPSVLLSVFFILSPRPHRLFLFRHGCA